MKLVNTQEMRRIEQAADASGHTYAAMMERAGAAVANTAHALVVPHTDQAVLILVGPGNNGGDGLVAAQTLLELGHPVTVYLWKRESRGDELLRKLRQRRRNVSILWADNDADWNKLRQEVGRADLIIDALLGTGVTRPIEGKLAELLTVVREEITKARQAAMLSAEQPSDIPYFPIMEAYSVGLPPPAASAINEEDEDDFADDYWPDEEEEGGTEEEEAEEEEFADEDWQEEEAAPAPIPWPPKPVLAVDCPSGLNCDTGALDPAALRAELTVTFAYPKWGHVQFPGAGACGLLAVADIGTAPALAEDIQTELVGPTMVKALLPIRPADAHKGTFGKALIVSGSLNYTGAAALSAEAAARAGTGLVTLAIPACLHAALAGYLPEITWLPLPAGPAGTHAADGVTRLIAALPGYQALLVGPGLTTEEDARQFVAGLFDAEKGLSREEWAGRTVVDADALNIVATWPDWPTRLPPQSILTPHPGEMARLLGSTPAAVNAARIATARDCAARWGHIVVLKGPHTVIAAPDGRTAVLPFAFATLATAGSGDVLAGAIVAMLAQGLPPYEAAICGAYLHGQAGLQLARTMRLAGHTAHDIVLQLPDAFYHLYTQR